MDEYRVPKRRVPATIGVPGQASRQVQLFLGTLAETHSGPERPSDLLNGPQRFFAVLDEENGFTLIRRQAVSYVAVPIESEFGDALPAEDLAAENSRVIHVEVMLEDGAAVDGTAVFLMPQAQQRLQDFANAADEFFALRADELVYLINTHRIVWMRNLEDEG